MVISRGVYPYAVGRSHLKGRFYLEKDLVYNLHNAKLFRIRIKSHKGAVEYLFNMLLSLYLVSNVSITMVKLIAFNGQFMLRKIWVNSVFPNTKLVNHFFSVKGLHDLVQGVLLL